MPYHLVSIAKTEGGSSSSGSSTDPLMDFNWDDFSYGTLLCDVENLENPGIAGLHELFEFFDETYSTVHPKAFQLQSTQLVIHGPFNNLKEEQDGLQYEFECLDADINAMELKGFWRAHAPQKLLEHLRDFNRLNGYPDTGGLACPCESCQDRNGTFYGDLNVNSDPMEVTTQMTCNLSCYLKRQLDNLGLTYQILSVDDLNYNGYTDDATGPDFLGRCKLSPYLPKVFPQDCHFVFVNKMDWLIFGYGRRFWSAQYLWSNDLHLLSRFFSLTNMDHLAPKHYDSSGDYTSDHCSETSDYCSDTSEYGDDE